MKDPLEIRKVLVVDDEPDIREILVSVLDEQNIQADQAENGKRAIEMLKSGTYHAVLCDIMMPEMTGLECLAQAQGEGVTTPFVFVTGFCDDGRMLQAVRLGAIDFINKPFDNDEIVDVVYRALEIGIRRERIHKAIEAQDPKLLSMVEKDERAISAMRVRNNKLRTG